MFLSQFHPYPRIALTAVVTFLLASCAGAPGGNGMPEQTTATRVWSTASLRSGFACCNLRYSGDQISSFNYVSLPFIAAGTPVLIREIDNAQAIIEVNGRQMLLRPDPAQTAESPVKPLARAFSGAALKVFPSGCVLQSSRVA